MHDEPNAVGTVHHDPRDTRQRDAAKGAVITNTARVTPVDNSPPNNTASVTATVRKP